MAFDPIQPKSVDRPVTGPERFERKYFIPASRVTLAAHLLRHCCVADREYPRSEVHSLYYDTPELDCFADSRTTFRPMTESHRRSESSLVQENLPIDS